MPRLYMMLTGLVWLLALPHHSAAQEAAPPFVIVPAPTDEARTTERGYFVYPLAAGAHRTGAVLLQNTSAQTTTIALAAVDAQTSQNGGSAFTDSATLPTTVGTWLTLDTNQVTLGPNMERTVPFTVTVPQDARPAQYLAGIAAQATPASASAAPTGATTVVQVHTRYVLAVQVEVPGAWTPALEIAAVRVLDQPQGAVLGVELRNTGDTLITATGTLVLRDTGGRDMVTQPIDLGTLVPGTAITHPLAWPSALPPAAYAVDVTLRYAEDQITHYQGHLTVPRVNTVGAAGQGATGVVAQALAPVTAATPPWLVVSVLVVGVLVVVLLVINLVVGGKRRAARREA